MKIIDRLAKRNAAMYEEEPSTIVCLGDSVTHGCFGVYMNRFGNIDTEYKPNLSYARLIEDDLREIFPVAAVNVINRGISGDSSAGALKRFARDVAVVRPNLVTVNLGLNDCMGENIDKSLDNYAKNMAAIFDAVREIGAECMLVTPNMMCEYVDNSLSDKFLREIAAKATERQTSGIPTRFTDCAKEIAEEKDIAIADAYSVWMAYKYGGVDTTAMLANGINHPKPEFHEIFARKIMDALFGV